MIYELTELTQFITLQQEQNMISCKVSVSLCACARESRGRIVRDCHLKERLFCSGRTSCSCSVRFMLWVRKDSTLYWLHLFSALIPTLSTSSWCVLWMFGHIKAAFHHTSGCYALVVVTKVLFFTTSLWVFEWPQLYNNNFHSIQGFI